MNFLKHKHQSKSLNFISPSFWNQSLEILKKSNNSNTFKHKHKHLFNQIIFIALIIIVYYYYYSHCSLFLIFLYNLHSINLNNNFYWYLLFDNVFYLIGKHNLFNSFMTEAVIIWKQVHWFAPQITGLVSIWLCPPSWKS